MSNTGLGRGLSSLIPQKKNNQSSSIKKIGDSALPNSANNEQVIKLVIEDIKKNPRQPRKEFSDSGLDELADSIKEFGIIQPLVVSREGDVYELIAGERRLRAAKKAGLSDVPVIIRSANDQEKLEVALIENIQREDLNPIELAAAYLQLMDEFYLSQADMGKRVGKSRPVIANTLRLLKLPEEIKTALVEGHINEGHAKFLVGLDTEVKQMKLFRKILHSSLTVEDTNQEAKRMGGTKAARIKINYTDKDKEFALREFFGARVNIKRKGRGGQIIIDFFSDEELAEIIGKVKV